MTFQNEPSLTASLQGMEGVQGAICTSWMRLTQIEPPRTLSNGILTEIAMPPQIPPYNYVHTQQPLK